MSKPAPTSCDGYAAAREEAERLIGRRPSYELIGHSASWEFDADPGKITLSIGIDPADFSPVVRLYSRCYVPTQQPSTVREAVRAIRRELRAHRDRINAVLSSIPR